MKKFTLLFSTLFLSLASLLVATPAEVIIIRHAERQPEGNELNLKGHERSFALIPFFNDDPLVTKFGRAVAVYAQKNTPDSPSVRPIQTVQALAVALKKNLNINFERAQYPTMVKEILENKEYDGKTVVIAWEHTVIPDIAEAFGVTNAPKSWDSKVFDRLWIIDFAQDGTRTFRDLPQKLMYGDSDK